MDFTNGQLSLPLRAFDAQQEPYLPERFRWSTEEREFLEARYAWSFEPAPEWTALGPDSDLSGFEGTVQLTSAPVLNPHLGPRTLILKLIEPPLPNAPPAEPIAIDSQDIELFAPRFARDHPFCASGNAHNWYYYWSRTFVEPLVRMTHEYEAECAEWGLGLCRDDWDAYYVHPCGGQTNEPSIVLCNQLGHGEVCETAAAVAHENAHHEHRRDMWPDGYSANEDMDMDTLPDAWEDQRGLLRCDFQSFAVICLVGTDSNSMDLACFHDWTECLAQEAGAAHKAAGGPCDSSYQPSDYCGTSNFSRWCPQ